ncbi:GTP pyrophosphokinase [Delftia tsuruhatensis]|uniref:GTP pyrophosphokinase n=1 Tax=Delftia tsuruhatensis TaxID=180282 RepID=UPI00370A52D1
MNNLDQYNLYLNELPVLNRLEKQICDQLNHLINTWELTLGVPIESRIKTWPSINEKFERKQIKSRKLSEIGDLIGIRVIFLFQKDLDKFNNEIIKIFNIISNEDVSDRLPVAQFGYMSQHYTLQIPDTWKTLPTMEGLSGYKIELQARTIAQHIWAAASHKLQYKHEASVPFPVRRSIHRVSALLETVDLEIARVLSERDIYINQQSQNIQKNGKLDVTNIEYILNKIYPAANKSENQEPYAELLEDLEHFDIKTREEFESLISKHLETVMAIDREEVHAVRTEPGIRATSMEEYEELMERNSKNVYFTHVGLARGALGEEFGEENFKKWRDSQRKKYEDGN